MTNLGANLYLDDDNVLHILELAPYDPFNFIPDWRLYKTEFSFIPVKTNRWLTYIWNNNPLHFATKETAEKLLEINKKIFGGLYDIYVVIKTPTVGPFRWEDQYHIEFVKDDKLFLLNAGLLAVRYAKYGETVYIAETLSELK